MYSLETREIFRAWVAQQATPHNPPSSCTCQRLQKAWVNRSIRRRCLEGPWATWVDQNHLTQFWPMYDWLLVAIEIWWCPKLTEEYVGKTFPNTFRENDGFQFALNKKRATGVVFYTSQPVEHHIFFPNKNTSRNRVLNCFHSSPSKMVQKQPYVFDIQKHERNWSLQVLANGDDV